MSLNMRNSQFGLQFNPRWNEKSGRFEIDDGKATDRSGFGSQKQCFVNSPYF